jgi:hypothetical protein
MKTAPYYSIVFALIIALSACSSRMNTRSHQARIKVPIAINVNTDNSINSTEVNPYLYRLKLIDFLDDFREVDLVLVENEKKADIILDIDVTNLYISPLRESSTTTHYRKNVQVGTDATGKPIFQTITAEVYREFSMIRSTSRLASKLTFKDPTYKVSPRNYFANYTWSHNGSTVGGDMQAFKINSGAQQGLSTHEPSPDELLFALTSQELLGRLSYDLRRYYQKLRKNYNPGN